MIHVCCVNNMRGTSCAMPAHPIYAYDPGSVISMVFHHRLCHFCELPVSQDSLHSSLNDLAQMAAWRSPQRAVYEVLIMSL